MKFRCKSTNTSSIKKLKFKLRKIYNQTCKRLIQKIYESSNLFNM